MIPMPYVLAPMVTVLAGNAFATTPCLFTEKAAQEDSNRANERNRTATMVANRRGYVVFMMKVFQGA